MIRDFRDVSCRALWQPRVAFLIHKCVLAADSRQLSYVSNLNFWVYLYDLWFDSVELDATGEF